MPLISVIIPTHNRPEALATLVSFLGRQELPASDYEIIVVDDGSTPPIVLSGSDGGPRTTLLRTRGGERSVARNTGAAAAIGDLLVFLDDDMEVGPGFLRTYRRANEVWPDAILLGRSSLPDVMLEGPFGRFRQRLEREGAPPCGGPTTIPNACAAGNMAIPHFVFEGLGGFDRYLSSGEDQDLALRHTEQGGGIVFVPEAESLHRDGALDLKAYCRRMEWGYENIVKFCHIHPLIPENIERERICGFLKLGTEPTSESLRKVAKSVLGAAPLLATLFGAAQLLEHAAPRSRLLDRLYRVLLGIHIFKGFRRGLLNTVRPPR